MDTDLPTQSKFHQWSKSLGSLFGFLILSWLFALLGPLSVLFPLLAFVAVVRMLAAGRLRMAVVFLILLPTSVGFVTGAYDYLAGSAKLRSSGLPDTTFHNLDPVMRCGRVTSGCIVMGNEWVIQIPYNSAVSAMVRIFGLMRGTYSGPYPSHSEAKAALDRAMTVDAKELRADVIAIGPERIRLDEGVGSRLLERTLDRSFFSELDQAPEITAIIWRKECVILRIPVRSTHHADAHSAATVLLSRSVGRPFAYYGEGDYHHHFPPVAWEQELK